jgi:hypothetical protein
MAALVAFVLVVVGLNAGAARAEPRGVIIGPITVCSVITFFDVVIVHYDCSTEE